MAADGGGDGKNTVTTQHSCRERSKLQTLSPPGWMRGAHTWQMRLCGRMACLLPVALSSVPCEQCRCLLRP